MRIRVKLLKGKEQGLENKKVINNEKKEVCEINTDKEKNISDDELNNLVDDIEIDEIKERFDVVERDLKHIKEKEESL